MGNGFSRMLQKMSFEMTRINEYNPPLALSDSEDEKKLRNNSEDNNKNLSPKIKNLIGIDEFKTSYIPTEHSEMKGNKLSLQDKKEKEPKV